MNRRLFSGWVAGLTVLLGVSGCSGIPDTGPVERVEAPVMRTHSTVHYEPAPPSKGAAPLQIVEGYLDAMLAYPQATGIVQEFMSPRAIPGWDSSAGVEVYSSAESTVRSVTDNRAEVAVQLRTAMSLDASGRVVDAPVASTHVLELRRVNGQWRVDTPVPGYLVSQNFARDYVRSQALWFFDSTGKKLVPEVVHAITSEQLPLTLVRRLAEGPRGTVRQTFLPDMDRMQVHIVGDRLELDIDRRAAANEDKITAQLLSTLRGVPGLNGIRILEGAVRERAVDFGDAVIGFGVGSPPDRAYGLRDDKVVDVGQTVKALAGSWGRSARGADEVAVGRNAVAALGSDGASVLVEARAGGSEQEFTGTGFIRPEWDDDGFLWLVDNPDGARVRVAVDGAPIDVDTQRLTDVQSFAVSPEGDRYVAALVADRDARVVVGDVERDADGIPRRLGFPFLVSRGLDGERDVGWASQSRVEFIADTPSDPQLHTVGIDGTDASSAVDTSALPGGVAAWAGPAVDGGDRWALDRRGRVWRLVDGGTWKLVPDGSSRAALTALSTAH